MRNNALTVLITGVTSGIGSAVAVKYAAEGWNIIGHYRSAGAKLKDLKSKLAGYDMDTVFYKADFLDERSIAGFISKILEHQIAVVINNAGGYVVQKDFREISCGEIQNAFMLNATAPMLIVSALFEGMIARQFARIVNISSIAAKYGGGPVSMHYGCAKRALEGLTRTISREGARYNVLINTIRPGVIDTDFHKKFPKDMESRVRSIPAGRMGLSGEVAEIVFHLGSGQNRFITGQTLSVAGGE